MKLQCKQKAAAVFSEEPTMLIRHYGGIAVTYDTSKFVEENRDSLPVELVKVFTKNHCNFGFVNYLFRQDIQALEGFQSELFFLIAFISELNYQVYFNFF